MKVLLIGHRGQLGSDLKRVFANDQLILSAQNELDVRDREQVRALLEQHKPGIILNCSAFHRVDDCEDQVEAAYAVNVYGVRNLALEARRIDAVLVHFSTDYVFDGLQRLPYRETDLPCPKSVYGVSKLSGEFMLQSIWPRHFLFRVSGLYGYAGSREKGTNFVEMMIGLARQGKPLRVVDDQVLTPTSTADVAHAVRQLVTTERYGLYHLTNGGECSWYQFTVEIMKLAGLDPSLIPVSSDQFPTKAKRPNYSVLDNGRYREAGSETFRFGVIHWRDTWRDERRRDGSKKFMQIRIVSHQLNGVTVIAPEVFQDDRGFFMEVYRADQFRDLGLPAEFVQYNHSGSVKGTVRGLHFQWEPPMGKLMRVTRGAAFLVAVDIRKGSPAFGQWFGIEASAENRLQVWAPAGFARGFCVVSEFAELQYNCTGIYNSQNESGILWNDPAIGIEWPVHEPILSKKDAVAQTLAQWEASPLSDHFRYPD